MILWQNSLTNVSVLSFLRNIGEAGDSFEGDFVRWKFQDLAGYFSMRWCFELRGFLRVMIGLRESIRIRIGRED